jgi:hypothetical protein
MQRLTRPIIEKALRDLSIALAGEGCSELLLVGGAAMVMAYHARESTKDVDAVFLSVPEPERLRRAVAEIAASSDLPADWLNDGAKGYLHGLAPGKTVLQTPALVVRVAAAEQLLAMKLSAWRDDVDIDDSRLLLGELTGAREAVWNQVECFLLPGRELKARLAFEDLWSEIHAAE